MPIFEYRCESCQRQFEAFVTADRSAECPDCGGAELQKLLSSPGMVGASSGARSEVPMTGGCGAGGASCACRAGLN